MYLLIVPKLHLKLTLALIGKPCYDFSHDPWHCWRFVPDGSLLDLMIDRDLIRALLFQPARPNLFVMLPDESPFASQILDRILLLPCPIDSLHLLPRFPILDLNS